MKDATYNPRPDGTSYRKGDDWAERIATGVADSLGVPAARTELAVRHGRSGNQLGVISKSVLGANEELLLGNELLAQPLVHRERFGYTVRAVRDALAEIDAPTSVDDGLSAWDVFTGFLILDALIGNTDRHAKNWAVIDTGASRRLSPTFDHASSLGFLLDDNEKESRLTTRDRGYTPETWADRAPSEFEGEPHPVDVAIEACATLDSAVRDRWLSQCDNADRLVKPISLVPAHRMSEPARDFARRVLCRNRERLLRD